MSHDAAVQQRREHRGLGPRDVADLLVALVVHADSVFVVRVPRLPDQGQLFFPRDDAGVELEADDGERQGAEADVGRVLLELVLDRQLLVQVLLRRLPRDAIHRGVELPRSGQALARRLAEYHAVRVSVHGGRDGTSEGPLRERGVRVHENIVVVRQVHDGNRGGLPVRPLLGRHGATTGPRAL